MSLKNTEGQIQGQTQGPKNIHPGEVQTPPSLPAEQADILFRKKYVIDFACPRKRKTSLCVSMWIFLVR